MDQLRFGSCGADDVTERSEPVDARPAGRARSAVSEMWEASVLPGAIELEPSASADRDERVELLGAPGAVPGRLHRDDHVGLARGRGRLAGDELPPHVGDPRPARV